MNYIIDLDDIDPPHLSSLLAKPSREKTVEEAPRLAGFRDLGTVIRAAEAGALASAASELEQLSRDELDKRTALCRLRIGVAAEQGTVPKDEHRVDYWLCNCEFTRRGIPPVFRRLPEPNTDVREQVGDAFAIDLQWLTARYADHATFRKWRGLWSSGQFHSTAKWISRFYPKNEAHWFVRGLSLTEDQQREMQLIKHVRYLSEFERLERQREEMRIRLRIAYEGVAKDPRHRSPDPKATIERRLNVWFCASLDNWKRPRPQRIANLYEALTGDKISRQIVAKTISIIQRDIPETRSQRQRPGPKRRQLCN